MLGLQIDVKTEANGSEDYSTIDYIPTGCLKSSFSLHEQLHMFAVDNQSAIK